MKIVQLIVVVLTLGVGRLSEAQCPPSCPIPGGGAPDSDCHVELAAPHVRLNVPRFDPANPAARTELHCFDGEAGCDIDGAADGVCTFDIDVCLHNADPALPACTPADVTAVTFQGTDDPDIAAAQNAVDALLPASSNVCTNGQSLRVPLGTDADGSQRAAAKTVVLSATTAAGNDDDRVAVTCVPHGWPSHGYNHGNHRATPFETTLTPENASTLTVKWHFDARATTGGNVNAVSSTPTVGFGMVYVTSWNGRVYGLRQETGEVVWTYDVTSNFVIGTQSSATLTADGRLLVGDSDATVHCLDARTGAKLWERALSIPIEGQQTDHNWGSVTVANNRVFVPIASHTDIPCTRGRLVALDLDTGDILWELATVPFSICDNDTSVTCESSEDCNGGNCVRGRGAGVTATPAVDVTGETVYMNTVGCYTFPSIGDSDSMFRIDAADGNVVWKNRVQPPEQFSACANDGAECRTAADCSGGAACVIKENYHDFGFLNGPLVVDADDGAGGTRSLIVSGSKDGTLYAFDPTDGDIVWRNEVAPVPVTPAFAGYGLFNAAIGFANQRIHAALFRMISPGGNPPDHLRAFSAVDGATLWQDEIGTSWSHVAIANDLVFAGTEQGAMQLCSTNLQQPCTQDRDCDSGGVCVRTGPYYIYDARDGRRLNSLILPANVAGGPSIVDGTVYIPYGTFDIDGGVVAYALPACLGDCNRNGAVTVDELVTGVNVALAAAPISRCFALDRNSDRVVRVDELVGGTRSLLQGCAG